MSTSVANPKTRLLIPTAEELAELRQIFAPESTNEEWRQWCESVGAIPKAPKTNPTIRLRLK